MIKWEFPFSGLTLLKKDNFSIYFIRRFIALIKLNSCIFMVLMMFTVKKIKS